MQFKKFLNFKFNLIKYLIYYLNKSDYMFGKGMKIKYSTFLKRRESLERIHLCPYNKEIQRNLLEYEYTTEKGTSWLYERDSNNDE